MEPETIGDLNRTEPLPVETDWYRLSFHEKIQYIQDENYGKVLMCSQVRQATCKNWKESERREQTVEYNRVTKSIRRAKKKLRSSIKGNQGRPKGSKTKQHEIKA